MALIKDSNKYPYKSSLVDDDYLIGSDSAQNGKTKSFKMSAIKSYVGSGGTSSDLGDRNLGAGTSAPPADQEIRYNNASAASVTSIYIDDNDLDGADRSASIAKATSGILTISDKENGEDNYDKFEISGVADNTGYFTFTVIWLESKGSVSGEVNVGVDLYSDEALVNSTKAHSTTVLADKFYFIRGSNRLTTSGNVAYTLDTTGAKIGGGYYIEVIAGGNHVLSFTPDPYEYKIDGATGVTVDTENGDLTLTSGNKYTVAIIWQGAESGWAVIVVDAYFTTGDVTAPTLSTAAIADNTPNQIVLTYDEALDESSVPAAIDFSLSGITGSPSISNVAISSTTVTLTLSGDASESDTITIDYTAGTNPIQDTNGNNAANLTGQSVTNNVVDPPSFVSAEVGSVADDILRVVYSKAVNATTAGHNIDTDGAALSISSISAGSGTTTVDYQLSRSVLDSEILNYDYDQGTGNTLAVANSKELNTVTNQNVTNNVGGVTSLVENYDAQLNVTHTGDGTSVTSWVDQVSSVNLNATNASLPTYISSLVDNSLPAINFNLSKDIKSSAHQINGGTNITNFGLIFIIKPQGTTGTNRWGIMSRWDDVNLSFRIDLDDSAGNTQVVFRLSNDTNSIEDFPLIANDVLQTLSVIKIGTSLKVKVNNVQIGTTKTLSLSTIKDVNVETLLGSNVGTNFMNSILQEANIYVEPTNETEIDDEVTRLMTKWSI